MNSFSHEYVTQQIFGNKKGILFGCVQPDVDEREDAYAHHFYNPVTLKDYQGSDDTAKNRCIYHLVDHLIAKDEVELGRSLHFLEDICTPVHTQYEDSFDAIYRLNLHTTFEKRLDKFLIDGKFNKQINKKYNNLSIVNLLEHCALSSSEIYSSVRRNEKISEKCLEDTINLAINAVKCFKDIIGTKRLIAKKIDKINLIIDGSEIITSTLESWTIARTDCNNNLFIFQKNCSLKNYDLVSSRKIF